MTTKDFIYLGLIALAALVFYCHGFFSGVNRSRRIYESLLGSAEPESPPDDPWSATDVPPRSATLPSPVPPSRGSELRGDFGNN